MTDKTAQVGGSQLDAAIAEFQRTIADLGIRLANAAITIHGLQQRNADLEKRIEELKPESINT